ncbi:sulfatase [Halovenus rubra]|uniref:Sulfatase n=2 Tax=Halovenus rubra TaxID=869890 RepID=A0ACC7DZQ5_9EURY|nr:sulfatase [Halovenus rubra]
MNKQPTVVLFVLDTVRRDRVSAYGYDRETTPAFDEFAKKGTLFEDAVSQSSWSVPSHASLFTGEYPTTHGATTVRPVLRATNPLPARLATTGYETYAVCPNVYIRPATGFGTGFDEFYTGRRMSVPESVIQYTGSAVNRITATPAIRRPLERAFNWWQFRGPKTGTTSPPTYGLLERVESIVENASEPFFLFVNLPHSHLPRSPAPEYRDKFVDDGLPVDAVSRNGWQHTHAGQGMSSGERAAMSQLYDADVRTADDRLRDLLGCLNDRGVTDDALVIVTADHGEHLGENGLVGHQHSVFDPVVSVPLAVDFPSNAPERITGQVETRRIYQTILDTAGVAPYPDRSLLSTNPDETARGSYSSPMLDLSKLLQDKSIEYGAEFLGEPLTFRRKHGKKLLCFDGDCWEVPGSDSDSRCLSPTTRIAR